MSGLTLFDLDDQYKNCIARIEANNGLLTPELEAEFDEVCDAIVRKENGYLQVVSHYDGLIAETDKWIKFLQAKKKAYENQKGRLKDRLIYHMKNMSVNVLETALGKIRLQKSKSTNVFDEESLPKKYKKIITTIEIDKAQLLKDLKAGEKPKGAELVTTDFIKVY